MFVPGLNVSEFYLPTELDAHGVPLGFFSQPVLGAVPTPSPLSPALPCSLLRSYPAVPATATRQAACACASHAVSAPQPL